MPQTLHSAAAMFLASMLACAAHLSPSAESAFRSYIDDLEGRLAKQRENPATCVAIRPDSSESVIRTEPVNGGSWGISGGLLHHWRGAAFVPGASSKQMLALLNDFDRLPEHYAPDVVSAHPIGGGVAMRFQRRAVVTVVLDAEFETGYGLGRGCGHQFSRSTHIWQVDEPGSPKERHRPEGDDDGFLWRLNSYWSFQERNGGLLIACEAVSLTRDVPAGLGWLVTPFMKSVPQTSLQFTLSATRNALLGNAQRRQGDAR